MTLVCSYSTFSVHPPPFVIAPNIPEGGGGGVIDGDDNTRNTKMRLKKSKILVTISILYSFFFFKYFACKNIIQTG